MDEAEDVVVEVDHARITVCLPGTMMKALYTKGDSPWLLLVDFTDDRDAPMKLTHFRVLAWSAATKTDDPYLLWSRSAQSV